MSSDNKQVTIPDLMVGEVIESSDWLTVTQELIDGFGKYTLDPDPFHIDPAWARKNSPFGGTIAFGFFTISMLTHFVHSAQGIKAREKDADPAIFGYYLNYGFNRLRLVSPVPVGARIRGRFEVSDLSVDERGRNVVTFATVIEIEGNDRPALVADWLAIWVPGKI